MLDVQKKPVKISEAQHRAQSYGPAALLVLSCISREEFDRIGLIVTGCPILNCLATAASWGSQATARGSSGEGAICSLPPRKALLPAMGLLSSLPAVLLMVNRAAPCWAAQVQAGDRIRKLKPPDQTLSFPAPPTPNGLTRGSCCLCASCPFANVGVCH